MAEPQNIDPGQAAALGRLSFGTYVMGVRPWFQMSPHIDLMWQALEAVERGDIKRLIIQAPPRHSKSENTTRCFPAWYSGKHPDQKVMISCHTQGLASEFGYDVKQIIECDEHKAIFPEHRLSTDSNARNNWNTTAGGKFFAVGITGGATGRGADLLIVDDPCKTKEEANSPVMRKKVQDFYTAVGRTRLQPGGRIIIISTRWHEHDLIGWLLDPTAQEQVDDWQVLDLPAIAIKDEGWRKEGEALWPDAYPLEELNSIRVAVGQWDWMAMYQQRPSAIEGMLVKRSWFPQYSWNPHMAAQRNLVQILTQPYRIIQSWDTALEEGQENDYSVCTTWMETPTADYLLDVWRAKVISPDLLKAAVELAIYWRAHCVLVEDSTPAKAFIQHLKRRTKLPILPRRPNGSKIMRLQAVSPYMESQHVHIPIAAYAPWHMDYMNEMCAFPTSAHDDQVDSTSQYLDWAYEQRALMAKYQDIDGPGIEVNLLDV